MALEGGIGQFQMPLEQWFYELPLGTRLWTTGSVLTSVLVQCNVVTPFQLFYSLRAVFVKNQYWRLATTFFYFGPLSLDLLLHIYFQQRYARLLEDAFGSGPTSNAHFSWLILYATSSLLALSPVFSIPFLGHALSSTLIYIWSRRNPDARLSLLGLATFTAPWLPLVFIGMSFLMHGVLPKDEICGAVVGHIYYFFADVWPTMYEGQKPLDPPAWWIRLFEGRQQRFEGAPDESSNEEIRWHQGQGAEIGAAAAVH